LRYSPASVLHDVFEHEYADIGVILGKTQASCRQLLHRARKRIRDDRPRFQVSQETRRRLLLRFLEATRTSDREALVNVLAEEATLISGSGGRVRAALKVIYGSDRIARLLIGLARKRLNSLDKLMRINGEFGIVTYVGSRPVSVLCCEVDEHRITQLYRLLNPDKLRAVPPLADAPIAQVAANNAGMLV
jgi:RNA polymerase sigma-70 factor (ECF subfamily)